MQLNDQHLSSWAVWQIVQALDIPDEYKEPFRWPRVTNDDEQAH
jgi:hypothetical protein